MFLLKIFWTSESITSEIIKIDFLGIDVSNTPMNFDIPQAERDELKEKSYYRAFQINENKKVDECAIMYASIQKNTHSDTIKAGNKLEYVLLKQRFWIGDPTHHNKKHFFPKNKNHADEFKNLINSVLSFNTRSNYIIYHNPNVWIDNEKNQSKNNKPDLIIVSPDNKIFIIELKIGDNFDTKKSKGERVKLEKIRNIFIEHLPKDMKDKVIPRFICWFCVDKNKTSIKDKICNDYLQLGKDFCKEFSINKTDIDEYLKKDNSKNLFDRIKKTVNIYNYIKNNDILYQLYDKIKCQSKNVKEINNYKNSLRELDSIIYEEEDENKLLKNENELLKNENELLKKEIVKLKEIARLKEDTELSNKFANMQI